MGLALLNVSVFTASSILSAKVSSALGNEVLISGDSCGIVTNLESLDSSDGYKKAMTIRAPWQARKMTTFANYVQNCYSVDRNASCPFGQLCKYNDRNIRLDTGPLNTNTHLGLNLPEDLRSTMRIVNHCAPLIMDDYSKVIVSGGVPYRRYFYGQRYPSSPDNWTYEYQLRNYSQFFAEDATSAYPDYSIGIVVALTFNGSFSSTLSNFYPINELFDGDGDVGLIFLSANDIIYPQVVNDPWYSAHQEITQDAAFGPNASTYLADEPTSVLGCKMQYQMCDLQSEKCSQLKGLQDTNSILPLPSTKMNETMSWVWGFNPTLMDVLSTLKVSSLTSRFSLEESVGGPLPDYQWQLDVENWHNIILASFQDLAVTFARGPEDADILKYFWERPETEVQKYLCKNQASELIIHVTSSATFSQASCTDFHIFLLHSHQTLPSRYTKILSTAYSNFSVLGLTIIFVLGFVIVILSYTLETAIFWYEKRRNRVKYSRVEWVSDETFQLQRLAHEGVGIGTWTGCAGLQDIPSTTEKGQLLGVLNLDNPDHPTIRTTSSQQQPEKISAPASQSTGNSTSDKAVEEAAQMASTGSVPTTSSLDESQASAVGALVDGCDGDAISPPASVQHGVQARDTQALSNTHTPDEGTVTAYEGRHDVGSESQERKYVGALEPQVVGRW
ncbi:MAG: hypothetical protein Q9160_005854 [Pyrenula sp. 1 TL-2023]